MNKTEDYSEILKEITRLVRFCVEWKGNDIRYDEQLEKETVADILSKLKTIEERAREENKDTQRLDFLDKLNKGLNDHYGTEYGWELIINHNVTRLFSGRIDRIDLNDAKAHGAKSCREVIDKAIDTLNTKK